MQKRKTSINFELSINDHFYPYKTVILMPNNDTRGNGGNSLTFSTIASFKIERVQSFFGHQEVRNVAITCGRKE